MKHRIRLFAAIGVAIVSTLNLARADLRDGLVAYWPLDTLDLDINTGQNMTPDLGPNTNHLFDTFSMTGADIVPGVRSNAASFDGASKYLSHIYTVGDDQGLPIYNARHYTVAMWVRDRKYLTGTNQLNRTFFSEASTANNNPLFQFTTDNASAGRTNLLVAAIRNVNGSFFFGSGVSFADSGKSTLGTNMPLDGNWHHIAWVDTNGVARLYVDGQLDPHLFRNTRISEPPDVAAANRGLNLNTFGLGALVRGAATAHFNGLIDDVAVWERALTPAEINQVRSNGIPLPIVASAPTVTNHPVANTNLLVGQAYSLQALSLGLHPRTYQWLKDGTPLVDDAVTVIGSTSNILSLPTLDTTNSGAYSVIISNALGSVTSGTAAVLVSTSSPRAPDLTNGQISYWPLDQLQGITTPDVVRGYDMLFGTGLGAGNIVPGKWGNAVKFNTNGILSRVHSPTDDLPISQYRNFTVSAWINAPTNQIGQRYYAEGSLISGNPWLSLGQVDNGTQAIGVNPTAPFTSVRGFVRNDGNQNNATVGVSASSVFYDPSVTPGGVWHHVVYIQEELGGATPVLTGRLYVDGVRDTGFVGSPRLPRSVVNSAIGGALRTGITGQFGGGAIDDVSVWNRVLTDQEISMLVTNVTPAAPAVLTPLQVISFHADLAETVNGDNATLRWSVSSTAAAIDIDQGVGNVLSKSTNGFGSIVVSNLTTSKTFTITIQRGTNVVTAQTSVAVVNGVTAGWTILDDFQAYNAGAFVNPYWSDLSGGSTVVDLGGNHLLNTPGGQLGLLPLFGNALAQGQARTIFARIYVQADPLAVSMLNEIGLTDKSLRNPNDLDSDAGPIVRLNDDVGGDLAIGARNGVPSPAVPPNAITLTPRRMDLEQVYNLWIDMNNGPANTNNTGDTFSIWLQRIGESQRILIASNYTTDRDIEPDFLGATGLNLDQLAVGNDAGASGTVYWDDIYISKTGINSTTPVAWAGPTPPALSIPTMTVDTTSIPGQAQFSWDTGALMYSPSLSGPWRVVPDSFSLFYLLIPDPAVSQMFFRVQR